MASKIITDHAELEKMPHTQLVEYAMTVGLQFKELESRISKLEGVEAVSTNCNQLLNERVKSLETEIIWLRKGHTKTAQYSKNRQLELHKVPLNINKEDLTKKVCQALSLTGSVVLPKDLDKCHRLKRQQESVIVEYKFREKRDAVILARKNLKGKKENLSSLGFLDGIVITESLCDEYRRLDSICHKLRVRKVIEDKWFFMGTMYIKKDNKTFEVRHVKDIEEVVGNEALSFLN